jgi:hypothetical protein
MELMEMPSSKNMLKNYPNKLKPKIKILVSGTKPNRKWRKFKKVVPHKSLKEFTLLNKD